MQNNQKRPHYEREELVQVFILGALAANPKKLLEKVESSAFQSPWSVAVAALKEALEGAGKDGSQDALNRWLERNLGVERNGDGVIDAALERLRRDAEFRKAAKEDGFAARLARLAVAMQDKRGKT